MNIMINQKNYKIHLIILILSIIYVGCIKNVITDDFTLRSNNKSITAMQNWLSVQKDNATTISNQNNIDSLIKNAEWGKSIQMISSNENIVIYVPLINSPIGLEFFLNHKTMNIDSGNIVKIISKENISNSSKIIGIMAYYENIVLNSNQLSKFNGTITSFSIINKFLYDYTFEDGKIISHGIIAPKIETSNNNIKTNSIKFDLNCQEWAHYTYWTNGDITMDYTYLVCGSDPCKDVAVNISNGETQIRSNCSGSGIDLLDPTIDKNPCQLAADHKNMYDSLKNSSDYINKLQMISEFSTVEKTTTFGKNISGEIFSTSIVTGDEFSATPNFNISSPFALLHSHPNVSPPSNGDFYNLAKYANIYSTLNTSITIDNSGNMYSLLIVDRDKLSNFYTNNTKEIYDGIKYKKVTSFSPIAIEEQFNIQDQIVNAGFDNQDAIAMSLAMILEKYNTGVELLKSNNGKFELINVHTIDNKFFTIIKCL